MSFVMTDYSEPFFATVIKTLTGKSFKQKQASGIRKGTIQLKFCLFEQNANLDSSFAIKKTKGV